MISNGKNRYGLVPTICLTIGAIILLGTLSFLFFTFGYGLITLILECFFTFILPFSGWYSFGAGLILLILFLFVLPGSLFKNRE